MADPSTTRKDIRQAVIKKLYSPRYPIVGATTSTASDTTSVVDSILAPSGQVEDYNSVFIYIAELVSGGPAIGEVARVTDTDFSGSTSKLTIAPAFTDEVQTGTDYEIHYVFHPTEIHDRINELLENMRGWVFIPLSGLLSDGNFNSGITITNNWTTSGTTQAINTTAAYILFGDGSMAITAGAVTTYSYQRVYVAEDTPLLVSTYAFVDAANSGTTAEIEIWDVTAGAQIGESAYTDIHNEWVHLQTLVTVPTDCKQVEVRLMGSVGTVYYDSVQLIRRDQRIHDLPSEFDWPEDFEIVLYFPRGSGHETSGSLNAFRALQYPVEKWSDAELLRDPRGATATRIQLIESRLGRRRGYYTTAGRARSTQSRVGTNIGHPLFVRGRVDYPTVSSDTTAIYAPEDYIVGLLYADLMEELAQHDLDNDKFEAYSLKMSKSNDIREKISFLARNNTDDKVSVRGTFNA